MGEYKITNADGTEYEITANSAEEAQKKLNSVLQAEVTAKQQAERDAEPMWAKPFRAAEDVGKTFVDAATLSTLPAAADWAGAKLGVPPPGGATAAQDVAAARDRLGLGAIPADVAGGIIGPGKFSLPAQAIKLGGGKLARGAIGLLAGSGQGAIEGGISAAARGESIPGGAGIGALSGGAGFGASNVMAGLGNRAAKWWRGINDILPPPNPKAPAITASGKVERAIADVQSKRGGGSQAQLQDAIADIRNQKAFSKKPDVLEQMNTVVQGDPATRGTKWLGNAVESATIPSSLMLGSGGNFTGMLTSAIGLPATAGILKSASKQGTKESVEELRRMLLNHPKYKGILGREGTDRLGSGVRRSVMEKLEEEQGY